MAVAFQQIAKTAARKSRMPKHNFQLRNYPWQIQPFLVAPVLPGETMKSLLMQSRVVTDPVFNPLIGWWSEHYFFYVKHRDLDERDDLTAMMLEPARDMSAVQSAADRKYNHAAGTINWAKLCLKRVVEEYFRDTDEAWDVATLDGLPMAKVGANGWMDDLITDANYVPPTDVDIPVGVDDKVTASEIDQALQHWQFMRLNNLTEMSYEDFLRSYGVRAARTELHRPELIRYARNWSYPSATVDPATGVPNSAVVWSVAERGDKDRYFTEPGFIFAVAVTRPKVYFSKQVGNVADWLQNAFSWLPATLTNDLQVSMQKFAAGAGPVGAASEAYWIDVRDLFLYGDQFVNFDLASTDAGFVALPTATLQKSYPSDTDALGLFTYGAETTPRRSIRQDGVVSLNILSSQRDQT